MVRGVAAIAATPPLKVIRRGDVVAHRRLHVWLAGHLFFIIVVPSVNICVAELMAHICESMVFFLIITHVSTTSVAVWLFLFILIFFFECVLREVPPPYMHEHARHGNEPFWILLVLVITST